MGDDSESEERRGSRGVADRLGGSVKGGRRQRVSEVKTAEKGAECGARGGKGAKKGEFGSIWVSLGGYGGGAEA